jgi:hypothetical protein
VTDIMPEKPATQRQIVLRAMQLRPDDLWPRAGGHVPLGIPGSPRNQKAYHEPGGSFSPSPRSFGLSFWIANPNALPTATSDTIPLDQITQDYSWHHPSSMPALNTHAPYYDCRWSQDAYDRWRCTIKTPSNADYHLDVMIRSVGPAGGPVHSIISDNGQLIINHRWVVSYEPNAIAVFLGDEEQPGWKTAFSPVTECQSENGWAYARIRAPKHDAFALTVRDTAPQFASPLASKGARSALALDLPDKTFVASLEAQAANLMMGFVARQTCPGEPMNYPLAWERDGAYAVLAMARCGQLDTAKELAAYFAENDFFGGFGAEGDAPGSAINAIVSTARISGDAGFTKWIWPHVQRKANLILEMVTARATIRKPWIGPIVPQHKNKECIPIVCQPAADGLITGSMDLHYPVLYVNAISLGGCDRRPFLRPLWVNRIKPGLTWVSRRRSDLHGWHISAMPVTTTNAPACQACGQLGLLALISRRTGGSCESDGARNIIRDCIPTDRSGPTSRSPRPTSGCFLTNPISSGERSGISGTTSALRGCSPTGKGMGRRTPLAYGRTSAAGLRPHM